MTILRKYFNISQFWNYALVVKWRFDPMKFWLLLLLTNINISCQQKQMAEKSLKNSDWKNKRLCLCIGIEILPELPSFPFGVGVSVVGLCLDYWSVGVCWVAVTGVCGGHAIGCDGYCDQCNRFHPRVLYPVPNHGARTRLGHPIFGQRAGYSGAVAIDSQ